MNVLRVLTCGITLLVASNAHAVDRIWIGATADLNTAGNWTPSGVPGPGEKGIFDGTGSNDSPTFGASTLGSNPGFGGFLVTGGQTANLSMTYTGTAQPVAFRFGGGSGFEIQSGAGAVSVDGANAFYWNFGTGTSNFINNSGNAATIGSNVTLNATGGAAPDIAFSGTGDWIIGGSTSGTIDVVSKSGSGTLTLNGNNNHTDGTNLLGGILKAGSTTAFGGNGRDISVSSGATVDLNGSNFDNRDYNITIAGTGTSGQGAIVNNGTSRQDGFKSVTLSGNATIGGTGRWDVRPSSGTGTVDLAGFTLTKTGANIIAIVDSNITSAGSIDINQGILALTRNTVSGAGSINVGPNGTLQFENYSSGSFEKAITVDNGTVRLIGNTLALGGAATIDLTNTTTFEIQNARTLTINGNVTGTGSLVKTDAGTLQINSGYTAGTLVVNGGTVALNGGGDSFNPDSKQININNGGTVQYLNDNVVQNSVLYTIATGGTLDMNGRQDAMGQLSGSGQIINTDGITLDGFGGTTTQTFSGTIGGAGGITLRNISGTQVLSGANSFTGAVNVQSGTLSISDVADGGVNSNLGAGTSAVGIRNGATLLFSGGNDSTNRGLAMGPGGGFVDVQNAASTLSVTGSVTGANNSLTKIGDGTLSLSGGYSAGTINVDDGILAISGGGDTISPNTRMININNGGTVRYDNSNVVQNNVLYTIATGGTLDMNGRSDAIGQLSGNGQIINMGGITLDGFGGTTTQTFSGTIAGSGGIALRNISGTQVLSGNNTYTGGTTINNGTLRITGGPASLPGNVAVNTNGTLQLVGNNQTWNNAITGAGLVQMEFGGGGGNTFLSSGVNGFTGTIELTLSGGSTGDKLRSTNINAPNADLIINPGTQLFVVNGGTFGNI